MRASTSIRALLFDLGGVLIDIDFDRVFTHWARFSPYPAADMLERFSFDGVYQRYERGEIRDADFFDHVRRVLHMDADDEQIRTGWNAVFVRQNDEVLAMMACLADRLPHYAFTNTSNAHQLAWTHTYPDVVRAFKRIFSSAEMGLRKPELAAYEAVIDAIGCDPASILFFDDLPSNIEGARRAGLQAVQVGSPNDIRAALADNRLL